VVVEAAADGSARVRPVGGLVAGAAQLFAAVLADTYFQGHTAIEVDLSEIADCDAAGVDVITGAYRYVQGCGKQIVFRDAPEWLCQLLDDAQLPEGLEIAGPTSG
jgi:ABC-type transporter Mla MlaB component